MFFVDRDSFEDLEPDEPRFGSQVGERGGSTGNPPREFRMDDETDLQMIQSC
ncbi:MAG: hypothetical protein ABEI52_09130 [Halobacteriaceae archaeon]